MPSTTTPYAALAADIDALVRLAGGRVPVVVKFGAGLQPIGAAGCLREARKLVKARGMRLDGDGRPQLEPMGRGDALVLRVRWK
jgi:hypothetical protein